MRIFSYNRLSIAQLHYFFSKKCVEILGEESKTVSFTVRKGRLKKEDRYAGLTVVKKILDIAGKERFCSECSTELEEIGTTFVRRELDFKLASFGVIEYYSKSCSNARKCKSEGH